MQKTPFIIILWYTIVNGPFWLNLSLELRRELKTWHITQSKIGKPLSLFSLFLVQCNNFEALLKANPLKKIRQLYHLIFFYDEKVEWQWIDKQMFGLVGYLPAAMMKDHIFPNILKIFLLQIWWKFWILNSCINFVRLNIAIFRFVVLTCQFRWSRIRLMCVS